MTNLSIVIPTLNSEKTLARCLDSILKQAYEDYEVWIMDGVSTDGTMNVVKTYMDKSDKIKCVSRRDGGIYDAMNKSIDLIHGEWVYFIGSDDELYDSQVLGSIFNRKIRQSIDFIYGNVFGVLQPPIIWFGKFDLERLTRTNICQQAIFYKKRVFDKVGRFGLQYKSYADWEFNIQCFCKVKTMYVNRIIANFSADGLSSRCADPIKKDMPGIINKYFSGRQIMGVRFKRFFRKIYCFLTHASRRTVMLRTF